MYVIDYFSSLKTNFKLTYEKNNNFKLIHNINKLLWSLEF
jgi:hypothetical protein